MLKKFLIILSFVVLGLFFSITAFAADKYDIRKCTVEFLQEPTYNGKAQTPAFVVAQEGSELHSLNFKIVKWENNVNAGRAKVTIQGTNRYTGTKTASFTIKPKSLRWDATVKLKYPVIKYTGKALTQMSGITVMMPSGNGTVVLTRDRDYTVSYQNNTNPGLATVTIRGKGNYKDAATTQFAIEKTPTITSCRNKNGAVELQWTKATTSGQKYLVQVMNANGKCVNSFETSVNSAYVYGLKAKNKYTFKVTNRHKISSFSCSASSSKNYVATTTTDPNAIWQYLMCKDSEKGSYAKTFGGVTIAKSSAVEESVINKKCAAQWVKSSGVVAKGDIETNAKKIVKYIAKRMTYDLAFRAPKDAFTRNRGTCKGYAAAFHYMCRYAGIEAQTIYGKQDSGRHAWNRVKCKNKWYYVDATFYDWYKDSGDKKGMERYLWSPGEFKDRTLAGATIFK